MGQSPQATPDSYPKNTGYRRLLSLVLGTSLSSLGCHPSARSMAPSEDLSKAASEFLDEMDKFELGNADQIDEAKLLKLMEGAEFKGIKKYNGEPKNSYSFTFNGDDYRVDFFAIKDVFEAKIFVYDGHSFVIYEAVIVNGMEDLISGLKLKMEMIKIREQSERVQEEGEK